MLALAVRYHPLLLCINVLITLCNGQDEKGLPPTPDTSHLECSSYHVHSSHRFISMWLWLLGAYMSVNGKSNLALTSLPPRKTHPRALERTCSEETAGHKDKDHLQIKLGVEAKKELICPVMVFEWRYLSVNYLCSRFSCRLTTATIVECAWSPVTRT